MGQTVAIIHQCCLFLIAFNSFHPPCCHYNDIQQKFCHLISVPLCCPTCNIQVMPPSVLWHLTLYYYVGLHSVHTKDENSLPQPQDSFVVKLIITITKVQSLNYFWQILQDSNSPCDWVVKALDCKTEGRGIEIHPRPFIFAYRSTNRKCQSLRYDIDQFDASICIEYIDV